MRYDGMSVKPFTYGSQETISAKTAYLMRIRGIRPKGLHELLAHNPDRTMVSRVCNGQKRSAPLEARIATVLGVTREELFGAGPLDLWRAA